MNSTHDKLRTLLLLLAISLGGTLLAAALPPFERSASGQTTGNPRPAPTAQPIRVPQLPPQATPTPAQTPAPSPRQGEKVTDEALAISDDDEIVRVTSNLVVVPVSVTNERGEPVQGLKATDFRLEEEGRAQEIAQVGDADQVPLDIAILFDVSSSVGQRFAFEQEAAARFLKQVLKPIDRAAVFRIEETPRLEQQLASADIASASLLKIPAPQKPTPTAFYDSTITSARYLAANAPGRHRRVIVVISDGDDNFSARVKEGEVEEARAANRGEKLSSTALSRQRETHRRALLEVQREVQRADAVFYSINPSGGGLQFNARGTRAQEGMQQLAETTGGTSFKPEQLEELDNIFRRIAAELRAQYLLQYYSTSDAPNGKFLAIKVRTPTRPDARVRARSGYYSKK
ncbi:MAG TPA: VWA domain-containing protein [Pyrinomonadaceae bacterium]|jgi:Ca-activated chloride channel family protein|nr:VWA domain-containing protein [Pyrinomonadaceae bacterium]